MTHAEATDSRSGTVGTAWIAGGVVLAILAAIVANTGIAALAIAAGAAGPFAPLNPASYVSFTMLGVVAGALGWAGVRRRAANPGAILRWLVPVVVALTFIPDATLLVADIQPNTSLLGVGALVAMHLSTAAIAVATYIRIMPVDSR